MAGDWRLIASGDSTRVPDVQLEAGVDHQLVVSLPADPGVFGSALTAAVWAALGPFVAVRDVRLEGARLIVELVP